MAYKLVTTFSYCILSILILSCGCSKNNAPDPPRSYSRLLVELFDSLENGDHKSAGNKISRLRELEPNNIFLAGLEISERNNFYINEIQKCIDKDNINSALEISQNAILKHGRDNILINLEAELIILKQLADLIEIINNPIDSVEMAKNIVNSKKIIAKIKNGKLFDNYIKEKVLVAQNLHEHEVERSIFDLYSDFESLSRLFDVNSFVLLSELEVENPEHPLFNKKEEILLNLKWPNRTK